MRRHKAANVVAGWALAWKSRLNDEHSTHEAWTALEGASLPIPAAAASTGKFLPGLTPDGVRSLETRDPGYPASSEVFSERWQ